jgi:FMN phosphatase YigB (HAD superfamily)
VCFDFRGVLLDHRTNEDILPGMRELLDALKERGVRLAVVSRFPLEVLRGRIEEHAISGVSLFSSSGRTKLDCIKELANGWGIEDLGSIAFIDDKPENLLSVSQGSWVHVIGFLGSGKYLQARDVCLEHGIPYAENAKELKEMLGVETKPSGECKP